MRFYITEKENPTIDMAKIQIKSEKTTPFEGIFSGHGVNWLHIIICNRLNPRSKVYIGYQHSEIIRFLMSIYFSGGSCIEDAYTQEGR